MKFEMWTWYHYLYIVAPFIFVAFLYLIFCKTSNKTKYIVAVIFAVINMAILITRNVDIFIRLGRMDSELIPLGPCHFANILFLLAVVTRKQCWYSITWCLNLPFGILALVFCDSLANYSTLLAIRPMAYLFGHFFLVASVLYVAVIGLTKFDFKSFKKSMLIAVIWLVVCVGTNIVYNGLTKGNNGLANYMYMVKPEKGTPMDILFNIHSGYTLWGNNINPVYIVLLSLVGLAAFFIFFLLHQLFKNGARKLRIKRAAKYD